MPESEQGPYKPLLAKLMLDRQEKNGSWWDYPLYNYHQQYEWGYLTEAYWIRTVEEMKCTFEHPWYRDALNGWQFRAEFQVVIDHAMADAVENPTGCWDFDFPYPIGE